MTITVQKADVLDVFCLRLSHFHTTPNGNSRSINTVARRRYAKSDGRSHEVSCVAVLK